MHKSQNGFGLAGALVICFIIVVTGFTYVRVRQADKQINDLQKITSFDECVAAGNPVMESFPEQCSADGQTFTKAIPYGDDGLGGEEVQEPNSLSDEEAISKAVVAYCMANGATSSSAVTENLKISMADPSLYVKSNGFARIAAPCGEGRFRVFLRQAVDEVNTWKFIDGTQEETIACSALDGTGIPAEVAAQCFDESGLLRPIQ